MHYVILYGLRHTHTKVFSGICRQQGPWSDWAFVVHKCNGHYRMCEWRANVQTILCTGSIRMIWICVFSACSKALFGLMWPDNSHEMSNLTLSENKRGIILSLKSSAAVVGLVLQQLNYDWMNTHLFLRPYNCLIFSHNNNEYKHETTIHRRYHVMGR